jgi:hypothetical protein
MLRADSRPDPRYWACEALGCLGTRADAAAPQLRALLKESDPWLQSLAAEALPNLSPDARMASVRDLLAMTVRPNPADPRRMAQRAACGALFSPYPGRHEPKSILAESLDGVDRALLYPAVVSVLQNEDSVARGSLARIYGKLTDEDLVVLLPAVVKAVEKLAPSDEMFGDGIRLAGLALLSRLHIREGLPLCLSVIEIDRWGAGNRLPKCLEYLGRYGTHAQAYLPQLREIRASVIKNSRGNAKSEHVQLLDKAIAAIQASTVSPTLVNLNDFKPGHVAGATRSQP